MLLSEGATRATRACDRGEVGWGLKWLYLDQERLGRDVNSRPPVATGSPGKSTQAHC